jgi:hypothetical protein
VKKRSKLPGKIQAALPDDVAALVLAKYGEARPALCVMAEGILALHENQDKERSQEILCAWSTIFQKEVAALARMSCDQIAAWLRAELQRNYEKEMLAATLRRDRAVFKALDEVLAKPRREFADPVRAAAIMLKQVLRSSGRTMTSREAQALLEPAGSLDALRRKLQAIGFPLRLEQGISRIRPPTVNGKKRPLKS